MRNQKDSISQLTSLCLCAWLGACGGGDSTRVSDSLAGASPEGQPPALLPPAPNPLAPGQPRSSPDGAAATSNTGSPFQSLDVAANSPETFSAPRAGVPLANDAVAFVATETPAAPGTAAEDDDPDSGGPRAAIFLQPKAGAPRVLYAGADLVSPLDIESSADGGTLFVADYAGGAEGNGGILRLPATGGDVTWLAPGYSPRSVTLGADEQLYFSGVDPESGEPGVFVLNGDAVTAVFRGAPLIDPSGIALFADGRVLVADTRLFDGAVDPRAQDGEAGVVLIDRGVARVFATGFATGFPAGIALTLDESTLILSGQGPDRSDTVYLVDVARPEQAATPVTAAFSVYQDSSAGLKRAHGANTFIWASLSAGGGSVFRIRS